MLAITLKINDFVFIGDDIAIKIKRSPEDGVVRLAIQAPRKLDITRRTREQGDKIVTKLRGQRDADLRT